MRKKVHPLRIVQRIAAKLSSGKKNNEKFKKLQKKSKFSISLQAANER